MCIIKIRNIVHGVIMKLRPATSIQNSDLTSKSTKAHYYKHIQGKVSIKNNYKKWTQNEIDIIMNSNLTARELSKRLDRSIMAIYCKKRQEESKIYAGKLRPKYSRISEEEKSFILEYASVIPAKEIAKILKMRMQTVYTIMHPRDEEQLEKNKESFKNWQERNPNYFKDYFQKNKEKKND